MAGDRLRRRRQLILSSPIIITMLLLGLTQRAIRYNLIFDPLPCQSAFPLSWSLFIFRMASSALMTYKAETLAETPSIEMDPYVGTLHVSGTILPGHTLPNKGFRV